MSSISPVPREGFVVLRRYLKTRAGGFPMGGKPDSIGRRLLSLSSDLQQVGRWWGLPEGGEKTTPNTAGAHLRLAGVRGWTKRPPLGVKGKKRIAVLPRGKCGFGDAAGKGAGRGAGTRGQGRGAAGCRGAGGWAGGCPRAEAVAATVGGSAARIL